MHKILRGSEARAVERGSILCESELRRNRASFLDFPSLCSHYATESLLMVTATLFIQRRQAIPADDHAGSLATAKDSEDYQ